jgi:hypothetical protein
MACSFVPGSGQHRRVLQAGPQDREHVHTRGGAVLDNAGARAWMFPKPRAFREHCRAVSRPFLVMVFSLRRTAATTLPPKSRCGSPRSFRSLRDLAQARAWAAAPRWPGPGSGRR